MGFWNEHCTQSNIQDHTLQMNSHFPAIQPFKAV